METVFGLDEVGLGNNKKVLLALMNLAGDRVEGFTRLKAAVYMLKDCGLHTYKFKGRCPLGYGDPEFNDDINWFGVYVNYDVFEDKDKNPHRLYELNELGKSYGREYASAIRKKNPKIYKKLEKAAELLSNPKLTATKLWEIAEKN